MCSFDEIAVAIAMFDDCIPSFSWACKVQEALVVLTGLVASYGSRSVAWTDGSTHFRVVPHVGNGCLTRQPAQGLMGR